ncbi:MAG: GNAT family protein [Bacteroidota bacterium]
MFMELQTSTCLIRSWRRSDQNSLANHANNLSIARNLRDAFPSPYTLRDAENWLSVMACQSIESQFAIDVHGDAVGGIGVTVGMDVHRIDGELGYWLGEEWWGKGIMTDAISTFVPYAFATFRLERIHAQVFEWNHASARVLEKSGFSLEGRLRRAVLKQGSVIDMFLYSRIREILAAESTP